LKHFKRKLDSKVQFKMSYHVSEKYSSILNCILESSVI
jgi:hypothetical protein